MLNPCTKISLPDEEVQSEKKKTLALKVLVPNSYMCVCVCTCVCKQTCNGVTGEVGRKPGYSNVISGDVAGNQQGQNTKALHVQVKKDLLDLAMDFHLVVLCLYKIQTIPELVSLS